MPTDANEDVAEAEDEDEYERIDQVAAGETGALRLNSKHKPEWVNCATATARASGSKW